MENFLIDFIVLYGPLGLGWIAAVTLYVAQMRERKQWLHLLSTKIEDNTTAMVTLITYLKAKMD